MPNAPTDAASGVELLTYLTAAAERQPGEVALRVGDRLELRPARDGCAVEAWSASGRLLGRLPPADRAAIVTALAGPPAAGRITALVPRPLLAGAGRIHIAVSGG